MNLFLPSAFFRLEKELSTFLTWLERCEAIASSPEMDISADRVKVESELQLTQASSRECEGDNILYCGCIIKRKTRKKPSIQFDFLFWLCDRSIYINQNKREKI